MSTRRTFLQAAAAGAALGAGTEVQVPKMKFFGAEISRLVAGVNPFYGYAHFNNILSTVMREYYTPERVCEVLRRCNQYGINAYNYVHLGRAGEDYAKYLAEGGKMHMIAQGIGEPEPMYKLFKPMAIYAHGERVDQAFQDGDLASIKEWCKKVRGLGAVVGVGTHKPEVIAQVEHEGWDVDFYAGCVYNRTRTAEEWKQALNGELMEMPGETYLQSDPPRMYKVMRQTKKPCFAFKIMAAGRISDKGAERAFQTAFESIKPIDGVFVGMFPRVKDEVKENAERVQRLLRS